MRDLVREALRNVEPNVVQLSSLRYDGRLDVPSPKFQERVVAYEFYHQLRKLQESGSALLNGLTQQAEVSKIYQGIRFIPDLIVHVPGEDENAAVFEFKLARNPQFRFDLYKLQHLKSELGYDEAFMVVIGTQAAFDGWLSRRSQFWSDDGEEICFTAYDPIGTERVPRQEVRSVNVPPSMFSA